jgi:hypothetical protein
MIGNKVSPEEAASLEYIATALGFGSSSSLTPFTTH